jgi:thiol:disulfide interchange protein DsbA
MRIIKLLLASLSFGLLAAGSTAFAADSKGYIVLPDAQPTESGKKVEVTEFFGYACPHCHAFDPVLEAWVKKQGDNIVFKRVPVGFRPEWVVHQKLFYTMEALGKTEEFHKKIFTAIHVEHQQLNSDDAITAFAVKNGVDKQKFTDALNSFSVNTKVKRAAQVMANYKVDQVPMIAIDGRYLTSPAKAAEALGENRPEAELQTAAVKLMDDLVAKSRKK